MIRPNGIVSARVTNLLHLERSFPSCVRFLFNISAYNRTEEERRKQREAIVKRFKASVIRLSANGRLLS